MKEYLHNGEIIRFSRLALDFDFLEYLNQRGITPEELPDRNFDYRVLKYSKDNTLRYACIKGTKIYITLKLPEDGFENLMRDVDRQDKGEEPQKMQSRLKIVLAEAEKSAYHWINRVVDEDYPEYKAEWFFGSLTGETGEGLPEEGKERIKKEYRMTLVQVLLNAGYDKKTLEMINAPDVDKDYLRELLKKF